MVKKLSESFDILAGTEQGHPMSPELFKIYIHDLSVKLNDLSDLNVPPLNQRPITHLFWAAKSCRRAVKKVEGKRSV